MITSDDVQKFEKLRRDALSKYDDDKFYNIKSLVNWVRYIKSTKMISEYIPKNGKVLDVGCGGGEPTALIKIMRPDCKIIGVDMIKRKTWPVVKKYSVDLKHLNAEDLRVFKDEEFDVLLYFGVLEHVDNEKKFLDETFRVLKKGGHYFIFDLPNKYGFSESIADFVLKTYHHPRKYTISQTKKMVSRYGEIIVARRENIIPAQFHRLSEKLGKFINRNYIFLSWLEDVLIKTPLNIFAQSITVVCKKQG